MEKQAPSYVGMKLRLTTHSRGYGLACDSILFVAFLLVCYIELEYDEAPAYFAFERRGKKVLNEASLFLGSGLMCILVRAML